ncbi:E3 ubiquitin-protein ligase RNF144A isoform X2 [Taeniopygia guttata]|uniref:E3 ubiquitin-protein ligase RNF144A isoform X2 n=1 Tax=Taeniopygia guttata TaxID=59729 RepID=UPI003BB90BCF
MDPPGISRSPPRSVRLLPCRRSTGPGSALTPTPGKLGQLPQNSHACHGSRAFPFLPWQARQAPRLLGTTSPVVLSAAGGSAEPGPSRSGSPRCYRFKQMKASRYNRRRGSARHAQAGGAAKRKIPGSPSRGREAPPAAARGRRCAWRGAAASKWAAARARPLMAPARHRARPPPPALTPPSSSPGGEKTGSGARRPHSGSAGGGDHGWGGGVLPRLRGIARDSAAGRPRRQAAAARARNS